MLGWLKIGGRLSFAPETLDCLRRPPIAPRESSSAPRGGSTRSGVLCTPLPCRPARSPPTIRNRRNGAGPDFGLLIRANTRTSHLGHSPSLGSEAPHCGQARVLPRLSLGLSAAIAGLLVFPFAKKLLCFCAEFTQLQAALGRERRGVFFQPFCCLGVAGLCLGSFTQAMVTHG